MCDTTAEAMTSDAFSLLALSGRCNLNGPGRGRLPYRLFAIFCVCVKSLLFGQPEVAV